MAIILVVLYMELLFLKAGQRGPAALPAAGVNGPVLFSV